MLPKRYKYKVEYAKSNRSSCKACKDALRPDKIDKDSMRLGYIEKNPFHDGWNVDGWYHGPCFLSMYSVESESEIDGFYNLRSADQLWIEQNLQNSCSRYGLEQKENVLPTYSQSGPATKKRKYSYELDKQNNEYYALYDKLKGMPKTHRLEILHQNDQAIVPDKSEMLHHLTDVIYYGALKPCTQCPNGRLVFRNFTYFCNGSISEWAQCDNFVQDPERQPTVIPEAIQTRYECLTKTFPVQSRIISDDSSHSPLVSDPWYDDVEAVPASDTTLQMVEIKNSEVPSFENDQNGLPVHAESDLHHTSHVFVDKELKYSVMLSLVDIQTNKNKYYKMQLLESDGMSRPEYWLYRSWGRVSTPTVTPKYCQTTCRYENYDDAREKFEEIFFNKTGNEFYSPRFDKKPNKYFKHDIDCGDVAEIRSLIESKWASDFESNLEVPVQNLIKLLFNERMMKETMLGFDLDAQILPCGKVSDKQIHGAMEVLKNINKLIDEGAVPIKFVEASNQFYTMIPHNFGERRPTIINSQEIVEEKSKMLKQLLEWKIVYDLVMQKQRTENTNPLDKYYLHLKTDLQSVDKTAPDYKMIEEYVKNTHSPFHNQWKKIEIEDVFQVKRDGEKERFEPFKQLHNRQLLWHGSLTTNFAGILRNGLKIAPPEAPSTGYIFGKGVYFADIFSKSAQYCHSTTENSTGLILLCQVALGNTLDLMEANYIEELPPDKHSVKGVGKTCTDPENAYTRPDGVIVPLGELVTADNRSQLQNNEYVVYDVAQIKCEYLLRIKFHHIDE